MRAHLEAVKALLQPLGRPVFLGDVTGEPQFPYFFLWSSAGALDDSTQDGRQDAIVDTFGVTGASPTYADALDLMRVSRTRLNGATPQVAGWSTSELRLVDTRPIQIDRDVRLPNGRFPAFGVDIYRLVSEPVPTEEEQP